MPSIFSDDLFFEVQGHSHDGVALGIVVGELEQLTGESAGEAVDAGDAVRRFDDGTDVRRNNTGFEALDLLADDGSDLFWSDGHSSLPNGSR